MSWAMTQNERKEVRAVKKIKIKVRKLEKVETTSFRSNNQG